MSFGVIKQRRRNRSQPNGPRLILLVFGVIAASGVVPAKGAEWCRTDTSGPTPTATANLSVCPTHGRCDEPANRDVAIPGSGTPVVTIRLKLNVFRETNGTNPTATPQSISAQLVQLQQDFLPFRIQFISTFEFIDDSTFRNFLDADEVAMKIAHADQPGLQLNVYVVDAVFGSFGSSTLPWNAPLGTFGGIVIDKDLFGAGRHILTHETGHALGLFHVHHGVSEVAACSACYELADGSNGDTTGDFCSDTPSTPSNPGCLPPAANDCAGVPFPLVSPVNYMGRAEACMTQFTAQQNGRMRCWIADVLSSWIVPPAEPVVPAVTPLGLVALVLALSIAGTIISTRRRAA